jgi:hypothetical protein
MKALFRATTPADGPAITAFLRESFRLSPDHPSLKPQQLHWKYWLERPDWPGPRSFVITRGAAVLAHAGVVPGRCAWHGGRLRTFHLIDWAARPGAIGAGTMLMKHIGRMTDALLAIGGSDETRRILPVLGFKSYGDAVGYVRAIRPLRRIIAAPSPTWRLVPQFARSVVWTATARRSIDGDWTAQRVQPPDVEASALPLPCSNTDLAILERSAAVFRYALACPAAPPTLHRIRKAGVGTAGYFLLSFAPGQARIADCWVDSNDPADWRALIQLAVRAAKEDRRAAELVTLSSDPAFSANLVDCGFHARTAEPIRLLATQEARLPETRLRVQMIDNDAAWRHEGRSEFWA